MNDSKSPLSMCSSANVQSILNQMTIRKGISINTNKASIYNKRHMYTDCQKSFNQPSQTNNHPDRFLNNHYLDKKEQNLHLYNSFQKSNKKNNPYKHLCKIKQSTNHKNFKRKHNSQHTSYTRHSHNKTAQRYNTESNSDTKLKVLI